ncbi:MAG TPA: 2-oxoglutarate dehydrogenase complex dihydrolipoyllysine-residue succinyltransferase [Tepidisphaeraceae bacterium]|jgi:2-oxoglutarate dehydrogenase E2 component (dihydrolipoamide succinyltransferase)|nr:2-oxoglutarate dehydrogenase complex dihydrolipoyllysine-residue succinyltransferase [Tepidisphaeraceae bacterium]
MPTNVVVPSMGESVTEAVLLRWMKKDGDTVAADEPIAELETDKANADLPAPAAGVLRTVKNPGDTVHVGETIARIDEGGAKPAAKAAPAEAAKPQAAAAGASPKGQGYGDGGATAAPPSLEKAGGTTKPEDLSPAVRKAVAEGGLDASKISGTGPGGRITKEDVAATIAAGTGAGGNGSVDATKDIAPPATPKAASPSPGPQSQPPSSGYESDGTKRVPMSKIRKKIAENLVRAQQTAAILTTFNEVDLTEIMAIRGKYKERFNEVHGIGLGLMSFFVRATVLALKEFPRVNAFLDGDDILYHDYVHMGIAVSTDRGLAVPVMRHAEQLSFAKIESEIKRLAGATREGKLALSELGGGTFTITNGGVFGSMLSTPIINPPQSGILGMHNIVKRPMVIGDKIEIRQMMYLALSYDHRMVDGKESVSFLVRIKQYLEDPSRLMLEI